jgi:hypothetical protein
MTGRDKVRAVVEAAATHAVKQYDPVPRRRRRTLALVAAIVLLASLLAGGAWALWRMNQLQDTAARNARIAAELGDQVRDLGATPRVAPPPVDRDSAIPGPPPVDWTWVDDDGLTQSCTRTSGTDTAPAYTCTAQPPPTVPVRDAELEQRPW